MTIFELARPRVPPGRATPAWRAGPALARAALAALLELLLGAGGNAVAGDAAREAAGPPDALQACVGERDDGRRLACYDRAMAERAALAAKSFGLTAPQIRKLSPSAPRDPPKPPILSSTVAAVTERADGRRVITLADGAVWVQGEAYDLVSVKAGDAVTIKPGLLGSFYLYLPSGGATRVTRAR